MDYRATLMLCLCAATVISCTIVRSQLVVAMVTLLLCLVVVVVVVVVVLVVVAVVPLGIYLQQHGKVQTEHILV